ncbi:MAG: hypothetical protein AB7U85_06130 [Alphaproteobacteria bacterium]
MKKSRFFLLWYFFVPFAVVFLFMLFVSVFCSDKTKITHKSNIEIARELYVKVDKTILAQVNHKKYINIIEERINCYTKHHSYSERVNICSSDYQKNIIKVASEITNKRPMIGNFVIKINECPVMFNMCRGEQKTIDECIVFEKKCLDYFLDKYWRGNWDSEIKEKAEYE